MQMGAAQSSPQQEATTIPRTSRGCKTEVPGPRSPGAGPPAMGGTLAACWIGLEPQVGRGHTRAAAKEDREMCGLSLPSTSPPSSNTSLSGVSWLSSLLHICTHTRHTPTGTHHTEAHTGTQAHTETRRHTHSYTEKHSYLQTLSSPTDILTGHPLSHTDTQSHSQMHTLAQTDIDSHRHTHTSAMQSRTGKDWKRSEGRQVND